MESENTKQLKETKKDLNDVKNQIEKHKENIESKEIVSESAEAKKVTKKTFFKSRKRWPIKIIKKNNYFTRHNINYIDYKDTKTLSKFVNSQGQIVSRTFSHLPNKEQRLVARAIKRARQMKLMPDIIVDQGEI